MSSAFVFREILDAGRDSRIVAVSHAVAEKAEEDDPRAVKNTEEHKGGTAAQPLESLACG